MPKRPIYTAETTPAVADTPSRYNTGVNDAALVVTRQAQQKFENFAEINSRLKNQITDLEFTTVKHQDDAGMLLIQQELEKDPTLRSDPAIYMNAFMEQRDKLRSDLMHSPMSDDAKTRYGNYIGMVNDTQLVKARGEATRLNIGYTIGKLDELENSLSDRAATADPTATNSLGQNVTIESINEYHRELRKAYQRGIIKEPEYEKRRQTFEQKYLLKNAEHISNTDPYSFIDMFQQNTWQGADSVAMEKIYSRTNERIRGIEATNEKVIKKAGDKVYEVAMGQANEGTLADTYIKDAAEGRFTPLISPEQGRALAYAKAHPIEGNSTPVNAIMDKFWRTPHKDPAVVQVAVETARDELNTYILNGGLPSPAYSKALRDLSTEEEQLNSHLRTIEAANRATDAALRGQIAFSQGQERYKYQVAEMEYEALDKAIPPMLRQFTPNQKEQELANIKKYLHDNPGADPREVVKEHFKKKNDAAAKRKPTQRETDTETILKGRPR